jgi:hypothetical protein
MECLAVPSQLRVGESETNTETAPNLEVSGGDVNPAAGQFVAVAVPRPGAVDLVDPAAEAAWQRRTAKQQARVRRVRSIEKGLESAYQGVRGSTGRGIFLWSGLVLGLGLLAFGLIGLP